jgi:superfamily II helicase
MMWWQGWQTPEQVRERQRLTCPCCWGRKRMTVITEEHDRIVLVQHAICIQCDGTGEVEER